MVNPQGMWDRNATNKERDNNAREAEKERREEAVRLRAVMADMQRAARAQEKRRQDETAARLRAQQRDYDQKQEEKRRKKKEEEEVRRRREAREKRERERAYTDLKYKCADADENPYSKDRDVRPKWPR